jgi:hypothetical protein
VLEQHIEKTYIWEVQSSANRILRLTTQKNHVFVFGMHWYSLIGAQSRRDILIDQRQKKATHYVESSTLPNSAGSVLGVLSLSPKSAVRQEKFHPAALAFARQHSSDTHIFILKVSNTAWWLVASNHGAVVCQTDIWYSDRLQVDEHVTQLKVRFLNVYIEDHEWEALVAQQDQPTLAMSWLLNPAEETHCLVPIPNSPLFKIIVSSGVGLVMVAIVLTYLWVNHAKNQLNQSNLTAQQSTDLTPESSQYQAHSHESISALVGLWHTLPIDPSGWMLKRVECERQNESFRCLARYKREMPHANNGQLARAIPNDWQLVADSLDQVSLVRDIAIPTQSIDWSDQLFEEDWLTPLQQRQAIFQSLQLGEGEAMAVSLTNTVRAVFKRPIRVIGPLRSLPALSGLKQPIQWQYALLEIVDQTTLDLTHSHFVLHLVGEMFVPS